MTLACIRNAGLVATRSWRFVSKDSRPILPTSFSLLMPGTNSGLISHGFEILISQTDLDIGISLDICQIIYLFFDYF